MLQISVAKGVTILPWKRGVKADLKQSHTSCNVSNNDTQEKDN